jgi:hypothetical protein
VVGVGAAVDSACAPSGELVVAAQSLEQVVAADGTQNVRTRVADQCVVPNGFCTFSTKLRINALARMQRSFVYGPH